MIVNFPFIVQTILFVSSILMTWSIYRLNKIIHLLVKYKKESCKTYIRIPIEEYEELTKIKE